MAEIEDLDITDASNTARFPEGMAPSAVNNGARALEGILARFHEDLGCRKASTGSANAYVFAAAQTFTAYYDGMLVGFDANFANTGAATIDVDGLGAKTIKKYNDADLASGDIESGQKVLVAYDGTNFQMLSPVALEIASQAQMEAGTDATALVTPANFINHLAATKCLAHVSVSGGTPTLQTTTDLNITSITDQGVGDLTITWDTDFSDALYILQMTCKPDNTDFTGLQREAFVQDQSAGTCRVRHANATASDNVVRSAVDPQIWNVVAYGDQA